MKVSIPCKRTSALALLAFTALLPFSTHAQEIIPTRASSVNPNGTNGMSQVISAESIGEGQVNLTLRGALANQSRTIPGAPLAGQQLTTVTGGLALGLNKYLDAFAALNVYNFRQDGQTGSGMGSTVMGAKFSIPFTRHQPLRIGAQVAGIFGTSGNQFNNNGGDGYNYLETRTRSDVIVRLTQSLLLTEKSKGTGFKIHLNEGVISSFEPSKEVQLITGAGVEFIPIISLIVGLEVNSRTFLNEPSVSDPIWVTPSVTWRTPAYVNVNLGVDVSVAAERDASPASRSLEPWRVFGGLTYSIDTRADKKRDAAYKKREAALANREDSVQTAALHKDVRDSRNKADSLETVASVASAKSRNDSIALAESDKRLQQELANRPELQQQLLSTGLLVLDAVYFETGKTEISMNSEPYLKLIAKMLTQYPKLQVEIGGHTDNVGGPEYNQDLSQKRSDAVVAYMVQVAPSLQGRLTAKGYAYSQPKASNNTVEGREKNRRTELRVTNKEALKEYR
jgi:outer membrane protein OmpA-like peptidoglycan-associated protein